MHTAFHVATGLLIAKTCPGILGVTLAFMSHFAVDTLLMEPSYMDRKGKMLKGRGQVIATEAILVPYLFLSAENDHEFNCMLAANLPDMIRLIVPHSDSGWGVRVSVNANVLLTIATTIIAKSI